MIVVTIQPLIRTTRCEMYMCGTMATHSISTPDSPPGQCFLLCLDHLKELQAALTAMVDDGVAAAEPYVVPKPLAFPDPMAHKPAAPSLEKAAVGWESGPKKRNTFAGDGK